MSSFFYDIVYFQHMKFVIQTVNAEGATQVMERHEFWSCGTYGFEHPSLAQMFSQAFFNLKQQILKQ